MYNHYFHRRIKPGLPIFSERTSPMFSVTFRLGGPVKSMLLPFRQYIHRPIVPLFWTQSAAGLKPPPQLSPEATHEQNLRALIRHFKRTLPTYGPHVGILIAGGISNNHLRTVDHRKPSRTTWKGRGTH
jgi:hypothetical protein